MQDKSSWKVSELAGCEVFTSQGERLGILEDVLPTGGNDIWVIAPSEPQAREIMIPALASVILAVDLNSRKITVELPQGLKDVYYED